MDINDIRELTVEELEEALDEAKEELMRFRFQQATGELTDTNQLKFTRKKIARIKTVMNQRRMEADGEKEGDA